MEILIGIIGIVGTLTAWFLNPKRKMYAELDSIYKQLEVLNVQRDKALAKNDNDALSIITVSIVKLCERRNIISKRL